jgi:hypothetical protein
MKLLHPVSIFPRTCQAHVEKLSHIHWLIEVHVRGVAGELLEPVMWGAMTAHSGQAFGQPKQEEAAVEQRSICYSKSINGEPIQSEQRKAADRGDCGPSHTLARRFQPDLR